MKVYVCPICDHVMKGKHYCSICHQFVKNPYYIDKNYSLDRVDEKADINDIQAKEEITKKKEKRNEKKSGQAVQKREKTKQGKWEKIRGRYRSIWMIVMVYSIFQVGIIIFTNLPDGVIKKSKIREWISKDQEPESDIIVVGKDEEGLIGEWIYTTPDDNEIIKRGEESTGLTHFAVNGQEFLDYLLPILNDADFEVVEELETNQNYIAINEEQSEEYTYFKKLKTFYLTDDYMEYYCLAEDFVSNRLVDTDIESRDYDRVCFYINAAASFLFPDNENKKKKMERLNDYLEKLLEEETYFSEQIGNMIISGYVYLNSDEMMYHISLSRIENA